MSFVTRNNGCQFWIVCNISVKSLTSLSLGWQSADLSGIPWYNLSSIEMGLVVSSFSYYIFVLHIRWLATESVMSQCGVSLWWLYLLMFQVSGSLYGALIGSILAFNISDSLGSFIYFYNKNLLITCSLLISPSGKD
mgnify:FL=1